MVVCTVRPVYLKYILVEKRSLPNQGRGKSRVAAQSIQCMAVRLQAITSFIPFSCRPSNMPLHITRTWETIDLDKVRSHVCPNLLQVLLVKSLDNNSVIYSSDLLRIRVDEGLMLHGYGCADQAVSFQLTNVNCFSCWVTAKSFMGC